jgi:hypothetical protein
MTMWRMTSAGPQSRESSRLDFEERIEDMIVNDSTPSACPSWFSSRQVPTEYCGFIDVLGLDAEGHRRRFTLPVRLTHHVTLGHSGNLRPRFRIDLEFTQLKQKSTN